MKVTVCQLPDGTEALEDAWGGLTEHVRDAGSDLVLLPEMPFHRWLPRTREPSEPAWREAVEAHRRWSERLPELAPAGVAATRPAVRGGRRRNEGFVWTPGYSAGKWLAAGRTAAVVAGAFGLSSNRGGQPAGDAGFAWAGRGWIVDPDGEVLGLTSDDERWITREIDPAAAEAAKETYPRYVGG